MFRPISFKSFGCFMLILFCMSTYALDIIRTKSTSSQGSIGLSTNALGHSIVAWGQCGDVTICSPKESSIYAQRIDSAGSKIGTMILLNSSTSGFSPKILYKDDGSFIAAWEVEPDSAANNAESRIYARVFDSQGLPLAPEFPIDDNDSLTESLDSIASLSSGNFIIYWSQSGGSSGRLFRRIFQNDGIPVDVREDISMTAVGSEVSFSQYADSGYYILGKESNDSVTLFSTVPFSVADLLPQQLNAPFTGTATSLLTAVNSNNRFVAGWEQRASSSDREFYITMTQSDEYIAQGVLVADTLFFRPSLGINETGKVLAARSEDSIIVANLYSNAGILENNSFQLDGNPVNIYDSQMNADNAGNFITAWSGSVNTSSTSDFVIRMQKVNSDGEILWSSNTRSLESSNGNGSGGGGGSTGLITFLLLFILIFVGYIQNKWRNQV